MKYEILCIDDCSTDGSYDFLLELKEEIQSLRIKKNSENKGVSYTRNKLISESAGKYIWFVDPDDMLCKNVAVLFFDMIEKLECDILLGNYIRIPEEASLDCRESINSTLINEIPQKELDFLPKDRNNKRMCAVWGGLFNKAFLVNNNLTMNEQMIAQEDTLFYYEFSLRTKNVFKWDVPCYCYRQRKSSVMNTHNDERSKKYYISMKAMLSVYQKHLEENDFDDLTVLLKKIHHSKQNVATTLASVYDKKYIKEQLFLLKKEQIYPYKFRPDVFKSSQNILMRFIVFLIPLKPFFWLYHYLYILNDKARK